MIVCSCSGVTDRDIRDTIAWMRASDPYTLITPGKIYRALGKSVECGGCIRLFVDQMRAGRQPRRACGAARPAPQVRPEIGAKRPDGPRPRGVRFRTIPYCETLSP